MTSLPIISKHDLIQRVRLFSLGIMPNAQIQQWYDIQRSTTSANNICIITLDRSGSIVNIPSIRTTEIYNEYNIGELRTGRSYILIFFKGEEFEQKYLYNESN